MMTKKKTLRKLLCGFMVFLLCSTSLYAQSSGNSNNSLIGRFSTGWNYYTKGNAISPQLNSFNNYVTLNYRVFDTNTQVIQYQFKFDFYEKTGLATTRNGTKGNTFKNRYLVKQLYAAYGDNYRQIKIGRIIPSVSVIDAYPINGVSAENIRAGKWFDVSAFGGSINDFYKNDLSGHGYNYGLSILHQHGLWSAGTGFTSEKFATTVLSKTYFYAEYKPTPTLRAYHRTQYIVDHSLIGYSQSSIFYRLNKQLSFRTVFDYRNRTSDFPVRYDTSVSSDKYFYSSTEKNVSLTTNYRAYYNRRIGLLDISSTLKKRFGNGNLIYADLRTSYKNYFWFRLNLGVNGAYTSNQWLQNIQTSLWLNRDFMKNKLDATLSYNLNAYQWNIRTAARNHLLSLITTDLSYRFTKDFYSAVTLTEEFGDATEPHTSIFVRLNYYLR